MQQGVAMRIQAPKAPPASPVIMMLLHLPIGKIACRGVQIQMVLSDQIRNGLTKNGPKASERHS